MQAPAFLGFWLINSVIIRLIGQLAPAGIVLGNQHVTSLQASLFAGYILSTINFLTEPTLKWLKIKVGLSSHWLTIFFLVNTLALWIITRLALVIGLGISAFWWAGILAFFTTLGQWLVWQAVKKYR